MRGVESADGAGNGDILLGRASANRLGGAGGADTIRGFGGDDALVGGLGDDTLDGDVGLDLVDYAAGGAAGADVSRGDAAANLFRGQGGQDPHTGGAGADRFDFDAPADSAPGAGRDVVTDFAHLPDRLDLPTIDARAATPAADEAFVFLGARCPFTAAGQARHVQAGGVTPVEASTDANGAAELQLELAGLKTLGAADFVL